MRSVKLYQSRGAGQGPLLGCAYIRHCCWYFNHLSKTGVESEEVEEINDAYKDILEELGMTLFYCN